jgi:hypothetical protein
MIYSDINPRVETFKISPSPKKILAVIICSSMSLILPDCGLGFILASCISSPVGFKKSFKNKAHDLKYKMIAMRIKYLWRLNL